MTSQGHPYARFRRALDRGNILDALSAATELQQVALSDALELCLLLARTDPAKYPRAALRWHGRYCREHRVDTQEAQAVLALLAMLTGPRANAAARALAEILDQPGLGQARDTLIRWAGSSSPDGRDGTAPIKGHRS